jgi:hypothetical protein
MRLRLLMRACFVAAETAGLLGLDWFRRSQPSSEKPISMLGIVHAAFVFLRPLESAATNFPKQVGVRRGHECDKKSGVYTNQCCSISFLDLAACEAHHDDNDANTT